MNWISLKAAYLAVLWVVEKKLKIDEKSCVGEWDTGKAAKTALNFSRFEAAKLLGIKHFDNSIYGSEFDDEMSIGNLLDGEFNLNTENEQPISLDQNKYLIAHIELLRLIQDRVVSTRCTHDFIMTADEVVQSKNNRGTPEEVDLAIWQAKPLPNYAQSALHLGAGQDFWFFKRRMAINPDSHDTLIDGVEYWLTNIEVNNEEFEAWLRPQLPANYMLPATAILKPQSGKYLIQFGGDQAEVKSWDGLQLIRMIIKEKTVDDIHEDGVDALELEFKLEKDKYVDIEGAIDQLQDIRRLIKPQKVNRYLNFRLKQLRFFIEQFWIDFEEYSVSEDLESFDRLKSRKRKTIQYAKNTDGYIKKYGLEERNIEQIVKGFLEGGKEPDAQVIIDSLMLESIPSEKKFDSYKRNIKNALKNIEESCPEFTRHIGAVNTKTTSGIIVKGTGFLYYPTRKIKWDTG